MLILNQQKKIFLGERLGEPGVWQFPQGGVERSYSEEENVLRELEEETGVSRASFKIIQKLATTNEYEWDTPPEYSKDKWRGQSQSFWVISFLGQDSEINLDQHSTPEFSSYKWVDISEVPKMAEPKRLGAYLKALEELKNLSLV